MKVYFIVLKIKIDQYVYVTPDFSIRPAATGIMCRYVKENILRNIFYCPVIFISSTSVLPKNNCVYMRNPTPECG